MDGEEEQDISKDGTPQDGDDGYPKDPESYPFAPNNDALPAEEESDSPAALTEEANRVMEQLKTAAEQSDVPVEFVPPEGVAAEPPAQQADDSPPPENPPEEQDYSQDVVPFDETSTSPPPDLPDRGGTLPGGQEAPAAALPPSHEELDSLTQDMGGEVQQSFGEQVQAFNDAGGDYSSGFAGDYDSSGEGGGLPEFADSVAKNAEQSGERLVEAIRRIDMMTEALERERL